MSSLTRSLALRDGVGSLSPSQTRERGGVPDSLTHSRYAHRQVLYPFQDHEVDTFERLVPPGHVLVSFDAWERRWDVETSTLLTDVCDRIRTAALPLMK